ncbi:MAG: hypothetical protein F4210_06965 [Holophagales bacterium]|nr:hypothetical protein [Holophagales bacterium]MYF95236.1 hypothetical protein [Holophagales bacterium]
MAPIGKPGSRAELLLTLARLVLPDAVRRSKQPLAVAIFVAILFLVFATVVTLGLLPAIFAIESDALRRNLLSLIACSVTAIALLAQVLLRAPVTWLLDLEDLLRLPVGFRDLYGLRFALSTIGYWLPVGTALVLIPTVGGFAVGPAALLAIFLNDLRIGKQPPTCHVWRESLTLPFPVRGIFGAPGRAMNVVIVFAIAFILGLTPLEWFGWQFFFVAVCLMLAGFLMAAATYGLIQLRWPQRNEGFLHDPDGARLGAALVAAHLVGLPGALSFLLWALLERQRVTMLTTAIIAVSVVLLAAAAAYASRRRQRRMLAARGRELLLRDPSH